MKGIALKIILFFEILFFVFVSYFFLYINSENACQEYFFYLIDYDPFNDKEGYDKYFIDRIQYKNLSTKYKTKISREKLHYVDTDEEALEIYQLLDSLSEKDVPLSAFSSEGTKAYAAYELLDINGKKMFLQIRFDIEANHFTFTPQVTRVNIEEVYYETN
ncbi:MAG: hypothetical protein LBS21_10780 [Clostridiales bacterium]|jgi:hypothetical protein|nr:hypothetical protein [Clostridiales bacterium]